MPPARGACTYIVVVSVCVLCVQCSLCVGGTSTNTLCVYYRFERQYYIFQGLQITTYC